MKNVRRKNATIAQARNDANRATYVKRMNILFSLSQRSISQNKWQKVENSKIKTIFSLFLNQKEKLLLNNFGRGFFLSAHHRQH